jgi:hypothetical protein
MEQWVITAPSSTAVIVPEVIATAQALVTGDKGLLAMDESTQTCDERFATVGIPQTLDARRAYRELIVTTPGLSPSISGAILYDETIRQQTREGTPFVEVLTDAGIIPGIKVDTGTMDMAAHPGETVTEALAGLGDRLAEYAALGARFAKWRAVLSIGDGKPSQLCPRASHLVRAGRGTPHQARSRLPRCTAPSCARPVVWSLSSSPKCSWTARTAWSSAARQPRTCLVRCSAPCTNEV